MEPLEIDATELENWLKMTWLNYAICSITNKRLQYRGDGALRILKDGEEIWFGKCPETAAERFNAY